MLSYKGLHAVTPCEFGSFCLLISFKYTHHRLFKKKYTYQVSAWTPFSELPLILRGIDSTKFWKRLVHIGMIASHCFCTL